MNTPGILGNALQALWDELHASLDSGNLTRETLETVLKEELEDFLDERPDERRYYPIADVAQLIQLHAEAEGNSVEDQIRKRQVGIYEGLISPPVKQAICARAKAMGLEGLEMLVKSFSQSFNFGKWTLRGKSLGNFKLCIEEAEPLCDTAVTVVQIVVEEFMQKVFDNSVCTTLRRKASDHLIIECIAEK